jgi:hypothetical protein
MQVYRFKALAEESSASERSLEVFPRLSVLVYAVYISSFFDY